MAKQGEKKKKEDDGLASAVNDDEECAKAADVMEPTEKSVPADDGAVEEIEKVKVVESGASAEESDVGGGEEIAPSAAEASAKDGEEGSKIIEASSSDADQSTVEGGDERWAANPGAERGIDNEPTTHGGSERAKDDNVVGSATVPASAAAVIGEGSNTKASFETSSGEGGKSPPRRPSSIPDPFLRFLLLVARFP